MMSRRIVILGGGESGIWAARLAQINGDTPFLSDSGTLSQARRDFLDKHEIAYEEGGHNSPDLHMANLVVKSPGIPQDAPIIMRCRMAGIPVFSEIEFAYRYCSSKIIAITGSNGKTTTSRLTFHILNDNEFDVGLAGNIGRSFSEFVCGEQNEWVVLELSSFQLEDTYRFSPHIAVFLNLTHDHMDRYNDDMQLYLRAKWNVTCRQQTKDIFIYNQDDKRLSNTNKKRSGSPQMIPFGLESWSPDHFTDIEDQHYDYEGIPIKGRHNAYNILATMAIVNAVGLSRSKALESLSTFVNDAHRLEVVSEHNGVLWINDSKATNIDSVYFAIEAMNRPVIWIAGGVDKGNDYSVLLQVMKSKVKTIIAMGINNEKISNFFKPWGYEVREVNSMEEAVKVSRSLARQGDVVLLSPACASFDLFKNYEERGDQFKFFVLN